MRQLNLLLSVAAEPELPGLTSPGNERGGGDSSERGAPGRRGIASPHPVATSTILHLVPGKSRVVAAT